MKRSSNGIEAGAQVNTWRGAWVASTQYGLGDRVQRGDAIYQARRASSDAQFTASNWYLLNLEAASGPGIGITVVNEQATIQVESAGIATAMLQDGAVTSAKLGSGAVHESNLNGDSVSTVKLKDGAVTASKFAGGVLPTPRGAGLGLELEGNDLDLVLDILNPAFPHRLVRTEVLTLDRDNNSFEFVISNDNENATWPGVISGNKDDLLLIEKDSATDAAVLDGVEAGDWFFVSVGAARMIGMIEAVRDAPADSGVRQLLFNGDNSFKKSLNQYLQPPAYGSGIIGFSSMGNPGYLRLALPAGVESSLSASSKLLLDSFKTTTVSALEDEILPESEYIEQTGWQWRGEYNSDNPPVISGSGQIGETNLGQLWAHPSSAQLTDVDRYGRKDHVFVVWKDSSNYIEYRLISNISVSGNQRYLAFNTSGNNINKAKAGTIAAGDSVSLRLYSSFVTNDRVAQSIGSAPNHIEVPSAKAVDDYVANAAKSGAAENVDGAGGTAGQLWTRGSSATNAAWADAGGCAGIDVPATNGTYTCKATRTSQGVTYSWVSD